MRVYRSIIFDFDGTIADSFDVFLEALQATLNSRKRLTTGEIQDLRDSSTKEIIKKLGVKPWQLPLFLLKGRKELSIRYPNVQTVRGMPEIIRKLSSDYTIYILSTNSEENIRAFLKRYQLSSHVRQIYGNIGVLGKAKSLKKLRKRENLDLSMCIYIGDEMRDIEAARKAGIRCITVGWGYNSPRALRSLSPDCLVKKPSELRAIIDKMAGRKS